ncbi:MAG TPA: nucleotidyltransferase [Eggerthellaceae bacterium]|nr:nucleotidyltransferase [Eggerthellaceae bacterium]
MAGISRVYDQIAKFAKKHDVQRVVLFGSRARGDAEEKSDIDIAISGCSDFPAFEDDVQEKLWSLLEVDIVNLDGNVSPELLANIKRDGKVIYEAL